MFFCFSLQVISCPRKLQTYEIGLMNFVLGFFCCFMGCDLGCCLIPCLINDFKDVTHTCPSCKAYIYTYKRLC